MKIRSLLYTCLVGVLLIATLLISGCESIIGKVNSYDYNSVLLKQNVRLVSMDKSNRHIDIKTHTQVIDGEEVMIRTLMFFDDNNLNVLYQSNYYKIDSKSEELVLVGVKNGDEEINFFTQPLKLEPRYVKYDETYSATFEGDASVMEIVFRKPDNLSEHNRIVFETTVYDPIGNIMSSEFSVLEKGRGIQTISFHVYDRYGLLVGTDTYIHPTLVE